MEEKEVVVSLQSTATAKINGKNLTQRSLRTQRAQRRAKRRKREKEKKRKREKDNAEAQSTLRFAEEREC